MSKKQSKYFGEDIDTTRPPTVEYTPSHKRYVTVTKDVYPSLHSFIGACVGAFLVGLLLGGILL